MAYVRGKAQPLTIPTASIEQARRRNAQARIELAQLEAEHAQLAQRIETMRAQVSTARRQLNRQIRELEAARAQTERITKLAATLPGGEPLYGGRKGLEAATRELENHELKGLKFGDKRRRPISHGTGRKYKQGCRCPQCAEWWQQKLKADRERYRQRADAKAA